MNFGGAEGPWDHASRLERLPLLQVVGIADPMEGAGKRVLDRRLAGDYKQVWTECGLYKNVDELLREAKPDVVFIGTMPHVRSVVFLCYLFYF